MNPLIIESLCEHADSCRGRGETWEGIWADLMRRDGQGVLAGVTLAMLQRWHAESQRMNYGAMKKKERTEVSLDALEEEDGGAAVSAEFKVQSSRMAALCAEEEELPTFAERRGFSDEVREVVKYLGGDLVERGEPRWQFARHRVLKAGQYFEKKEGPGELEGRRWLRCAVVVWWGGVEGLPELVEVYPEHRVKRVIRPDGRLHCHETLRLEVFSLVNIGHVKSMQELLAVEVRLKGGLREKDREKLESRKRRLECKLAFAGETSEVTVLRVEQIVARLATVMDLHCPELTGVGGNGAALGAATGRTRAAQSAARLKLVQEVAERTGARGKYAGLRAGGKYAAKGREMATESTREHKEA